MSDRPEVVTEVSPTILAQTVPIPVTDWRKFRTHPVNKLASVTCLLQAAKKYHNDLQAAQDRLDDCLSICQNAPPPEVEQCVANCMKAFNLDAAIAATNYTKISLACLVPAIVPKEPVMPFPPLGLPLP